MDVLQTFRRGLQTGLHHLGAELVRYPESNLVARRVTMFKYFGVDVVLDVGANTGQYATELRRHGYSGRLVSFEPLSSAFCELNGKAEFDPGWLAVHAAVGEKTSIATINISANSYSSSLLPMLKQHEASAPESTYVGTEEVQVVTLDEVFPHYCHDARAPFLKIDTQGYERQVLDGAAEILSQLAGLQLEMSLADLYAGGMLFNEALERVTSSGFTFYSVEPGFFDKDSGRLLQLDGIFFRC